MPILDDDGGRPICYSLAPFGREVAMKYRDIEFHIVEDVELKVDGVVVTYTYDTETNEYLADYVVSESLENLARALIDVRLDADV